MATSRAGKNLALNLVRGAGKVIKSIVKSPIKIVDNYIEKSKKMDEYKKKRDDQLMRDNGWL